MFTSAYSHVLKHPLQSRVLADTATLDKDIEALETAIDQFRAAFDWDIALKNGLHN